MMKCKVMQVTKPTHVGITLCPAFSLDSQSVSQSVSRITMILVIVKFNKMEQKKKKEDMICC